MYPEESAITAWISIFPFIWKLKRIFIIQSFDLKWCRNLWLREGIDQIHQKIIPRKKWLPKKFLTNLRLFFCELMFSWALILSEESFQTDSLFLRATANDIEVFLEPCKVVHVMST